MYVSICVSCVLCYIQIQESLLIHDRCSSLCNVSCLINVSVSVKFLFFSQLLAGVDTLKFISQQLDSIDRITDVHVQMDDR